MLCVQSDHTMKKCDWTTCPKRASGFRGGTQIGYRTVRSRDHGIAAARADGPSCRHQCAKQLCARASVRWRARRGSNAEPLGVMLRMVLSPFMEPKEQTDEDGDPMRPRPTRYAGQPTAASAAIRIRRAHRLRTLPPSLPRHRAMHRVRTAGRGRELKRVQNQPTLETVVPPLPLRESTVGRVHLRPTAAKAGWMSAPGR